MEKDNRLRVLNILGGAKEGGAEKFFERISLISDMNYLFFLIWSSQNFLASFKSVILDSDSF